MYCSPYTNDTYCKKTVAVALDNALDFDEKNIISEIANCGCGDYEWAEKKFKEIKEKFPNNCFALVEFSDNDGSFYSAMEHGGFFDHLVFEKFNKH